MTRRASKPPPKTTLTTHRPSRTLTPHSTLILCALFLSIFRSTQSVLSILRDAWCPPLSLEPPRLHIPPSFNHLRVAIPTAIPAEACFLPCPALAQPKLCVHHQHRLIGMRRHRRHSVPLVRDGAAQCIAQRPRARWRSRVRRLGPRGAVDGPVETRRAGGGLSLKGYPGIK